MSLVIEREAAAAVWGAKRVWALHAAGALLLAALAYLWLAIPDARWWQVGLSAGYALALALVFLWLQGSTLEFFSRAHAGSSPRVRDAFRATLRRLPALVLWALLFALVLWVIDWVGGWRIVAGNRVASALTLTLRTPVSPEAVGGVLNAILWALAWVWAPLRLLPLAAEVAANGFGGFGGASRAAARRTFRRGRYWFAYVVLLALGTWLPAVLIDWMPKVDPLWAQAASLLARFLAAYFLLVTAWLLLLSLITRHRAAAD